ncbi:preprotein translocase subunit TatC [Caulobacter sp. Root1455]|uniref:group III truncated hemoglobin n=1 Tax=unclassified Caulobacter TaxID=2648921 RepID=UPI0006F6279C|nr:MULTISPECIES: group III truncated hemoglobin [unclassified Caulobacter]KQY28751.1 preprotein translocase subunit TatC [Caulobacter sp. Root487D2Y]KQY98909.1 preprotein translocase subunit TatC [Caulobacter sp. Root1455]
MDPRQSAEIEAVLPALLERFYARVRQDAELGPVFNDAIGDWDHHLGVLTDFWSSVMLASGRYKGNPMQAHMRHGARIHPEMFERWLAIWTETTDEMVSPPVAADMQAKAARIAQSLNLAITFRLPKAEPVQPAVS